MNPLTDNGSQIPVHQKKYNTYRKTFPEFVFENYQYDVQPDGLHISFLFRINGSGQSIIYQPSAVVAARRFLDFNQPKAIMDQLVFQIGMVELVSYWKSFCPPVVRICCGRLSDQQIAFWKKLYFNGLGEFFYTNSITATLDNFMTIVIDCDAESESVAPAPTECASSLDANAYLVPIGGGKDSVVTLECLHGDPKRKIIPLIMNPRGATTECVAAAGYTMDDVLVIKRTIHPTLLEMNAKGALNGHTPFSAMLAFYACLASQLSGYQNIALSNESSANESTVVGTGVNHQYSKSLEFEDDFRAYVKDFLFEKYNYFSFLRPLSELQIAQCFSRQEKYFSVFKSCNAGSKQDIWCGKCAKCLFAYIILSPFIAPEVLNGIFGKNMLDDPSMETYFDELRGCATTKPFECVGTIDEVNTALSMTLRRWYSDGNRPVLLSRYKPLPEVVALNTFFDAHNLSESEYRLLRCFVISE